ncbi:PTS sugar transporter subunit IIB [uncultured Enorma sp.]|uniref:PTS sugar transporter subunit IIB n=1 Tax=uncultured Enorma sp. TaxID=1714346 RepID=UPI0028053B7F|nr:PTS sugar transporter subunit IIB [uncultured Enorma sp.]
MVELLRVDDRLLHGQVAYAWSKSLPINLIVIANDEVSQDKAAKATFALAKPAGMNLVISTVEKTIAFLGSEKARNYRALVLVNNLDDAAAIARSTEDISAINVGGMREHDDSKRYLPAVCLTPHDTEVIAALSHEGYEVYAQQVPSDTKTKLAGLLG